jgi:hypothetical protein
MRLGLTPPHAARPPSREHHLIWGKTAPAGPRGQGHTEDNALQHPPGGLPRDVLAAAWEALLEPEWRTLRAILERDVVYRAGQLTSRVAATET